MNPLNYGSLAACKRLVEAGIVLKTDFYWREYNPKTVESLINARKMPPQPYLINAESRCKYSKWEHPAPSLAEVWRELPERIIQGDRFYFPYLIIRGAIFAGYCDSDEKTIKNFCNANPTDALIDLKIWTMQRKEAGNERY